MSKIWYYADGDTPIGPLSLADLKVLLSRASNARSILVWQNSYANWVKVEAVPELAQYAITPPPIPATRRDTIQIAPLASALPTEHHFAPSVGDGPTKLHLWRRYFARMIDLYIFILVFFISLGALFPEYFAASKPQSPGHLDDYLYSILGTAAYVIFETMCLNTFGTTFGKALYGIRVNHGDGNHFAFSLALKRSVAVWFRGLGVGIPLFTLIALIVAYNTVKKDGQATWDRDFNCLVTHRQLSVTRWILISFMWLLVLSVPIVISAAFS